MSPIGLSAYLAFTKRADVWAERKLQRRLEDGKEDPDRLGERRGVATRARPEGPLAWFHCASVGESLSIIELIRRLCDERPDLSILVTTGTRTSAELLSTRLPHHAFHQYVPVDTANAVKRFLDHWKPDLAVWVESELWPRMLTETSERGIPMVLLNARMSERSHKRWRWLRGTARAVLARFDLVLAQDQKTGGFLTDLGLEKRKLQVIGTLKEGAQVLPYSEDDHARMISALDGRPLWLAASTHPGEEEIVAEAQKKLRKQVHRMLLILVPRHPERGPELAKTLTEEGWSVALRSEGSLPTADTQIYIADTLGELGLWFRLAPISLIAGSLTEIGGHNPFEPAALGSTIVYGPHVKNFADIYARLDEAKAARLVHDADELAKAVSDMMSPDVAAKMAHAAWEVSSRGAEVTDKAMAEILALLDRSGS